MGNNHLWPGHHRYSYSSNSPSAFPGTYFDMASLLVIELAYWTASFLGHQRKPLCSTDNY